MFVPVSHTGVFLQCELGAARFRVRLRTVDRLFRLFIFPVARFGCFSYFVLKSSRWVKCVPGVRWSLTL